MSDHSRYYITGAFVLGAVVALGIQNLRAPGESAASGHPLGQQSRVNSTNTNSNRRNHIKTSSLNANVGGGEIAADIKEGIEGCIGNTPLIKIKSLSEATGCEILAKAEVYNDCVDSSLRKKNRD